MLGMKEIDVVGIFLSTHKTSPFVDDGKVNKYKQRTSWSNGERLDRGGAPRIIIRAEDKSGIKDSSTLMGGQSGADSLVSRAKHLDSADESCEGSRARRKAAMP